MNIKDIVEIIDSEVMYSIIFPIIMLIINWIKEKNDINKKNKELGFWMIKYEKIYTFTNLALDIYKGLIINYATAQVVRIILQIFLEPIYCYIISGFIHFGLGVIIVLILCSQAKAKVELLTASEVKVKLIIGIYLIISMPFFINLYGDFSIIISIVFTVLLLLWVHCLFKYCDVAFILDKSYADIYIKGSETIYSVAAGTLKKQGDWIFVTKELSNHYIELRIREDDIARTDYYGEPIVKVVKSGLKR